MATQTQRQQTTQAQEARHAVETEAAIHGMSQAAWDALPPEIQQAVEFAAAAQAVGIDASTVTQRQAATAAAAAANLKAAWVSHARTAIELDAMQHFGVADVELLPFGPVELYLLSIGRADAVEGVTSPVTVTLQPYTMPTMPTMPTTRARKPRASSEGNAKAAEAAADVLRFVGASYLYPTRVGGHVVPLSGDGQLVTRVGTDARTCFISGDNAGRPVQAYHRATRTLYWVSDKPAMYSGRWQAMAWWKVAEKADGVEVPSRKAAGLVTMNAGHEADAAAIDAASTGLLSVFDGVGVPETVTQQAVTLAELTTLAGGTLPDVRPVDVVI